MEYQRHVPAFLKAHAHLLGKGHAAREEEPVLAAEEVKADAGTDSEDEQVRGLSFCLSVVPRSAASSLSSKLTHWVSQGSLKCADAVCMP